MSSDSFDLRAVEQAIAGTEFAGQLHHVASTASTNDLALQAAQSGARHGVWIAGEQTAGRGRGNHAWHSSPGDGLYMSVLTAPFISMQSALSLSFTTAIAVQSAISSIAGFRRPNEIDIRWPNDLLLTGKDGTARKCGGILIDAASNPATSTQPAMLRHAVIGIGVNLNHLVFPPELDPIVTSLRRELPNPSQPFRCEPLAAAILVALDEGILRITTNTQQPTTNNLPGLSLYSSWISGKRVRVDARDGDPGGYTGVTAGLDPHGFLRVLGDDGQLHTVLSGGLREA